MSLIPLLATPVTAQHMGERFIHGVMSGCLFRDVGVTVLLCQFWEQTYAPLHWNKVMWCLCLLLIL